MLCIICVFVIGFVLDMMLVMVCICVLFIWFGDIVLVVCWLRKLVMFCCVMIFVFDGLVVLVIVWLLFGFVVML